MPHLHLYKNRIRESAMHHPFISMQMPIELYRRENGWSLEETSKVINISEDRYNINVTYPIYALSGQPLNSFNLIISTKINEYINNFKNMARDLELSTGGSSELLGSYSTYTAKQRFITAKNDLYPYLGGAHPGHDIMTTTYDTAAGVTITFADFFKKNSSYLERLSKLSENALFSKYPNLAYAFNDPVFRQGFAPKEENFTHWALTDNGLIIFFPEYQTAPYAAGALDIEIPYEAIRDIISYNM